MGYGVKGYSVRGLLRGDIQHDGGDDGEDDVGKPRAEDGREAAGNRKHCGDLLQEHKGEHQPDAEEDVDTNPSGGFPA